VNRQALEARNRCVKRSAAYDAADAADDAYLVVCEGTSPLWWQAWTTAHTAGGSKNEIRWQLVQILELS